MSILSVLDLSFVTEATPPSASLANSVDLAILADELGYARYWVAEHHSLASVASSAPEVIIARIAAATRRIRVGAGGVMLPNHAPLMVAERFRTLEAFFPGRIDLGLGRAPGTDQTTAYALRRHNTQGQDPEQDFLERLQELILWDTGDFPASHPFKRIAVMPNDVRLPPIFLLGSSDYSADLSAQIGMGFAFAHHFASYDATAALTAYRARFQPSAWRSTPYAILAVAVVAADSETEAERLAASADLNWLRRARGEYRPLPSPEEALAAPVSERERAAAQKHRRQLFVGTPAMVKARLDELAAATQADEIMITSPIYDHAARKRSYELMAKEYAIAPIGSAAGQARER
ncbi:MAG: LLM class flavin-dependent oxidoreductase [Rhodoblastus sp.]|jgi:luciferase family oxidoreductase group 1